MKKRVWLAFAGCILLLSVTAAAAGEIVFFTNGTYLKVDSHEVKGDMVQVQLDAASRLAFPARMIDRIEGVTGVVWGQSTTVAANQALPGVALPAGSGSGMQKATAPGSKRNWNPEPGSGLRAPRPAETGFAMSGSNGSESYINGVILNSAREAPDGTKNIGNKVVVNPDINPRIGFKPTRIQPKNPVAGVPGWTPPPSNVNTPPVADPPVVVPPDEPSSEEPELPEDPAPDEPSGGDEGN